MLYEKDIELDAFCLQETWIGPNNDISLFKLHNYNLVSQNTNISRHGGLAIYLHKKYAFNIINIHNNSEIWEGQFIEIPASENNKPITLINIYKPPKENTSVNINTFTTEISPILQALTDSKPNIIISDDFNIDLLKINEKRFHRDFFDTMITNGLFPAITLPTRFSEHSCTLIDNIFSSEHACITSSGILLSEISDHLPCFASFNLNISYNMPTYRICQRRWTESLMRQLYDDISAVNIYEKLNHNPTIDPNINYNILEKTLDSSLNKIMPHKSIKFNKYKHKKSNWITAGIIRSIKFKDKLYKLTKILPNESNEYVTAKNNLRVYKSILNKCIRHAKSFYYTSQLKKFKNNSANTWKILNELMSRKTKYSYPSQFIIDNHDISNKQIISNKFNLYFSETGRNLSNQFTCNTGKAYKRYLPETINSIFNFKNISECDVKEIICGLAPKNSFGYDFFSTKLLKYLEPILIKSLTLIINQSLNTGIFPEQLKLAKVIPIFKKDNPNKINNYRPISLLPSLSKVFEKVVYKQICSYFDQNHLFNPNQYGFRKHHSTEYAILELTDRIISYMDQGFTPLTIFLDLSKAFDTLDHEILLHKLNYYGIHNTSLNWFRSYLLNRKQYVDFDNFNSDTCLISTGVPQGSILGPLLFNIYINDIVNITKKCHIIQYADDTSLIYPMNDKNARQSLEMELEYLFEWLTLNKLSLNISKTKYMLFSTRQKNVTYPIVTLNKQIIENVSEFNFLGVKLDENMTWNSHTNQIANKINRNIAIMHKLKHILPTFTMKTLYESLISSHLNYGILAWGLNNTRLYKLQKKAIRTVANAKYNAHTEPLFKLFGFLKLPDILKVNTLKFYYKYVHQLLPDFFYTILLHPRSEIHKYETRHSNKIQTNKTRHKFADLCIRNQLPLVINAAPANIIQKLFTHSFGGYSSYVKNSFIEDYNFECTLVNCFTCKS